MSQKRTRTLNFGRIDAEGVGRKENKIQVFLTLNEETPEKPIFTVQGCIENAQGTDWVSGGQNQEQMMNHLHNNRLFVEIYNLWNKHHLNDIHAGTPEQENYLNQYKKEKGLSTIDYHESVNVLKAANLYTVEHEGKTHRYGNAHIYHEIPEKDLARIRTIMGI